MNLPQIRQDRANHFIYGFAIYVIFSIFFTPLVSTIITFVAALGKELYDEYKYKGFDIVDLIFTMIPGIILTFIKQLWQMIYQ